MKILVLLDKCYLLAFVLLRISVGLFFAATGFNKIFVIENQMLMLKTITDAGIPFPEFMALFVSVCELLFGLFLAVGFLTRVSSFVLLIICSVALFTVGINQIPSDVNFITWYSWLLYLPETLYILICLLMITRGSGTFSIDNMLANIVKNRTK